MKDFVKKHKYLFVSFGIVLLIFSYFIFFNDSIFLFAGDSYEQQYKFYVESWSRLRDGSLPFWDWSNFLGNNYYGSNTFYFLGSPFFWLVMLVPDVDFIKYSFLYLNLLKSILCILFTYMWLYKINRDSLSASIGGLIATFSSYVLVNYPNNHIFDAICFIPLCLYFVECYLQEKKTLGLSLSTGYLGIVSYYYLYLFIPFGCIYALVRYLTITDKPTIKSTFQIGIKFVLRILLGVLISSITLLPSYYVLQGNPRSDALPLSFNTIGKLSYFRFLTSFLTPICDWRINLNSFISTSVDSGIGWGGGFADYSLMISIFCTILLFFINNKKIKYSGYALLGVYAIFTIFPFFYILFNQNYETRWVYVFSFIFAYIVSNVLFNIKNIKPKHYIISGLIILLIIWLSFSVSRIFNLNEITWEISFLTRNCIIISIIVTIYIIVFVLFNNKKYFNYLLLLIIIGEIIFSFYSTFYGVNNYFYEPMSKDIINEYNSKYKGAAEKIKNDDNSFYRIDKDVLYDSLGGNDAYYQRYKSFYSYHSIYNYNQQDFIKNRFSSSWIFQPQTGKDILKSMLGSKYWFTYKKDGEYLTPYGYSYYSSTDDGATIYKNDYPITFGYFRDKTISKDYFQSFSILNQDYLLLNYVVLEHPSNSDTNQTINIIKIKNHDEVIDAYDINDKEGYMYIEYKNDIYNNDSYTYPNWNFAKNNNEFYSGKLNKELSYIGLSLPKNVDSFECNHENATTIYYDDMSWYEDWYISQEIVDPDSVKWDDNSISGNITVSKDGYFVSSVPYDKGWTVKLDGKKIDYLKVNEGFVGFEISKGTHSIEMTYVPPGLIAGFIISISSLILCFVLYYFNKKDKIKLC